MMALYVYDCNKCGERIEEIRRVDERDEQRYHVNADQDPFEHLIPGRETVDDCGGELVRFKETSAGFTISPWFDDAGIPSFDPSRDRATDVTKK